MQLLKLLTSKGSRFKSILMIISLFGTINIFISTQDLGIGLTPDSVNYITTARNIVSGNGITSFDNKPLILYPPLYPICLAIVAWVFNVDPLNAAVLFNAILFGIIIYISGLLLFKHLNFSILYSIWGTVTILIGIPLIMMSQLALSETLFICLVTLYLFLFEKYLKKGTRFLLFLVASTVALACLTRYIGIILIITGLVNIIFARKKKLAKQLKHIFLFTVITILPILSFLLRNLFLTGTFWGIRETSNSNLVQNSILSINSIYSWYVPNSLSLDNLIILVLLMIAGILTGWLFIKKKTNLKIFFKNNFSLISFIIFYLSFLIISSSIVSYNQIGYRLLSPIFIPLSILIILWGTKLLNLLTVNLPRTLNIGVLLASIFLWYILLFAHSFQLKIPAFGNTMIRELGYNSISWTNNQTIKYLQQTNRSDNIYLIYSNDPYALYILANIGSKITPTYNGLFNGFISYNKVFNIKALRGIWPEKNPSYLIWFDRYSYLKPSLYGIDELNRIAYLRQIVKLDDGTIYLISKK